MNKGKTVSQSLKDRFDYAENTEKTYGGLPVDSYECETSLARQEFMLCRNEYLASRRSARDSDVIAYQIRQAFKPGEVSPEEANKIGYEPAMRFTKGKHAFTVSTHTDRANVHNHIIFNTVDLNAEKKLRNFFLSSYALRRLSDIICAEHGLSIIEEKPRMDRFIRFRSLGTGYSEGEFREAVERNRTGGRISGKTKPDHYTFSLMKDFEQILLQKKGKGYENRARHFNNTQAAEVLIFLQENNIDSYEKLDTLAEEATARFHALSDRIKSCESRLKEIGSVKTAIVDYSKTRGVYEEYRKAGYSKKFFESHLEEITIHQAAKKIFDTLPSGKIPKVKELSAEYTEVLIAKKEAIAECRTVKKEMQQYTIAQKNVEMLLNRNSIPERNAQPSRGA